MSETDVLAHAEAGVGRLTLNRPKALHALTTAMCRQMTEAFFMFYIQYRCWRETSTPRDCAGLARGLVVWGLDRFLFATRPTCKVQIRGSLHCVVL